MVNKEEVCDLFLEVRLAFKMDDRQKQIFHAGTQMQMNEEIDRLLQKALDQKNNSFEVEEWNRRVDIARHFLETKMFGKRATMIFAVSKKR